MLHIRNRYAARNAEPTLSTSLSLHLYPVSLTVAIGELDAKYRTGPVMGEGRQQKSCETTGRVTSRPTLRAKSAIHLLRSKE